MRTAVACLLLAGVTGAEPAAEPQAPMPRELPPQPALTPAPLPPLGYYRVSAYEVWQNLSVDRQGIFRPRVLYTPYGAFYRYNGQPFPWANLRPVEIMPQFMPYAQD